MKMPDRAPEVCARLAAGEPLTTICADRKMPNLETVVRWLADCPPFRRRYTQARRVMADRMIDEVVQIADGVAPKSNEDEARRSRLRIEARKWAIARFGQLPEGIEFPPSSPPQFQLGFAPGSIPDLSDSQR